MRKTTGAVLVMCAVAALAGRADGPEPDTTKAELKKLQGTWKVTKRIVGKAETKALCTFTFDGDKLTRTMPNPRGEGDIKVAYKVKADTKKTPHTIELIEDRKRPPVGIVKDRGLVC